MERIHPRIGPDRRRDHRRGGGPLRRAEWPHRGNQRHPRRPRAPSGRRRLLAHRLCRGPGRRAARLGAPRRAAGEPGRREFPRARGGGAAGGSRHALRRRMHQRPRRMRRFAGVAALDRGDRRVHGCRIRDRFHRAPPDLAVKSSVYTAASFAAGFVFGLGLLVAGMANPAKVLAFLDLAGAWDPSLALVMAGALPVGAGALAFIKTRTRRVAGARLILPSPTRRATPPLLGSLVFGVGWGLAGICPGPALVLAGAGPAKGPRFPAG